jgi:hypothetical protein
MDKLRQAVSSNLKLLQAQNCTTIPTEFAPLLKKDDEPGLFTKGSLRTFPHQNLSLNAERLKYLELPDIAKKRTMVGLVDMSK